eukprot:Skav229592  [mRNA]  locus=scaffold510:168178:168711:+ [translate_table: standard]
MVLGNVLKQTQVCIFQTCLHARYAHPPGKHQLRHIPLFLCACGAVLRAPWKEVRHQESIFSRPWRAHMNFANDQHWLKRRTPHMAPCYRMALRNIKHFARRMAAKYQGEESPWIRAPSRRTGGRRRMGDLSSSWKGAVSSCTNVYDSEAASLSAYSMVPHGSTHSAQGIALRKEDHR